jgi:hypothetical protein
MKNAEKVYYELLKNYISLLLQNKYINGREIKKNKVNIMKASLATWLTC